MIRIRPERPADFPDIDELVRESFLKGTPYSDGQAEVALIHEIRAITCPRARLWPSGTEKWRGISC